MSLKQLLLAMLTLVFVALAYSFPSMTQLGEWLLAMAQFGLRLLQVSF